jgi:hypothetical protein
MWGVMKFQQLAGNSPHYLNSEIEFVHHFGGQLAADCILCDFAYWYALLK